LLVADDPLARNSGISNTQKSRATAAKRKKAGGRASGKPPESGGPTYFAKPELDDMGGTPAGIPVGSAPPSGRPVPRSTSGKPGQRGGFKSNKRGR